MSLEHPQNPRRGLRNLPAPEDLPGDPWSLRTTKQVAELLGVDPACLTVWRYRGLGPCPEPRYFKGSIQVYRLDRVQSWLAQRLGLAYDADAAWAAAMTTLVTFVESDVRALAQQWVGLLGPQHAAPLGCRWMAGGFQRYLDSFRSDHV